jgi:parallel beta-helix repeat protein
MVTLLVNRSKVEFGALKGRENLRRRNILITIVLIALLAPSLFFATKSFFSVKTQASSSPFYVGVECGYNNVTLDEALIDKVKNYTNLFIISSTDIVENSTLLNEVCDYAYNAGLYFSVYFSPIQSYTELGENVSSSFTFPNGTVVQGPSSPSPLPLAWLNSSMAKYGDRFLGAYVFDEPGGIQLDGGGQRTVNADQNTEQTYLSTSTAFVNGVNSEIQPYLNSSIMTYTADYGLYWFDYKAGYDTVLAELGLNNNNQLAVSLCRGAASAQNKNWGVIITHFPGQPLESGSELYNDSVFAYNSGANYFVVFDYAYTTSYPQEPYQPYEYGILQDQHFDALQNFWNYTQSNPGKHGSLKADVALVLPQAYGFGFRSPEDSVWGIFSGDEWSQTLWSDVNGYLSKYGSRLDIVYDDPAFNNAVKSSYSKVIQWTVGSASANLPVRDLNTTFGYSTIQEAITSGATSDGDVISVKAGVYPENLVVNKTLSIVGENRATTIIDGENLGTTVNITSSNVSISGFTIKNSGADSSAGIYLDNVENCSISDNTVTADYYGIYLDCSDNNTLRNNAMDGNLYNFGVDGNDSAHFINNVDSSNTVNGKKVYYLIGDSNLNINPSTYPDVGYLALVNCTGITVQDLSLSSNGNGILLVNTQNSTLTGNKVANSTEGIRLIDSEGNVLKDNTLTGNSYNFWVQGGLLNYIDASNTLNGKPVYYWISQSNKAVPSNAGYVALINCSGITVQNLSLASNRQNIVLSSSTDTTVSNNQISNSYNGIALEDSSTGNSIIENTVVNCTQGIALSDSNNNNIANNVLSSNQYGAYVNSSSFNTLSQNTVTANIDHGMQFILNCNNNTVIGNSINNNNVAVEFTNSSGNTIVKNSLTGNTQSIQILGQSTGTTITANFIANSTCGIEIAITDALSNSFEGQNVIYYPTGPNGYPTYPVSSSHMITQNTLTNNTWGILVNMANNTDLTDNTITGSNYGIDLGGSAAFSITIGSTINDTLSGNTVTNSSIMGISLNMASNCSVVENTVIDGQQGIILSYSQNNLLTGNNVSNNTQFGIQLSTSSNGNIFRDNTLAGNTYGFDDESIYYSTNMEYVVLQGQGNPQYYTNDVDASNTENGKPIIYWVGQSDQTVPSDASCVILVNCTNIIVQNQNLTGNYYGLQLAYTNNSTVTGNIIQGNSVGIQVLCSSYNSINGNSVISNSMGISLTQEDLTTSFNPTSQTYTTLTLPSTGNTITENNIESNTNGVAIGYSTSYNSGSSNDVSGNTFYHNNFVNNTSQVTSVTSPTQAGSSQSPTGQPLTGQQPTASNSWDNGKEGNYWSDYKGTDSNHDGIGDTPYLVYTNNVDHYPLMTPFNTPTIGT